MPDSRVEIHKASDLYCEVSDARKKINWDQQLDKSPIRPSKISETFTVSEDQYTCFSLEEHDDKSRSSALFKDVKMNSVTFDMSPQIKNQMPHSINESPYPTPLNLAAGMLTPGTVPNSENFRTRTIRTQFVYPILDLSESTFEEMSCGVSAKSRDGNGIQNSASNCKDQKDIWHCTTLSLLEEKET